MDAPVSDLTSHLGYRVRQLSNHVSHAFARKLAEQGVTVAEWAMMRMMHGRGPVQPSRLAERMGMTPGAITKLAGRLVAKRLVARIASDVDARSHALVLTGRGERLVPELARLADRNDAECFAHLSEEERLTLMTILERTIARLGIRAVAVD